MNQQLSTFRTRGRKLRRLILVLIGLATLSLATALVFTALDDTLVFFFSPSEVMARTPPPDQRVRLGGLVAEDSVEHLSDVRVRFVITDGAAAMPVIYEGLLPNLFREGQGVIAEGHLGDQGIFRAESVLAKHDENYMPPEVAEKLKEQGHWQGGADMP